MSLTCCWTVAKDKAEEIDAVEQADVYSMIHMLDAASEFKEDLWGTSRPSITVCQIPIENPEDKIGKYGLYKRWSTIASGATTCPTCLQDIKTVFPYKG